MSNNIFLQITCIFCAVFIIKVQGRVTDEEYALMPPVFYSDDFDRCMALGKNALYCSITAQLTPIIPNNSSYVWTIIQEVTSHPKNHKHDQLRHGLCVPEACPDLKSNITFYKDNEHLLKERLSKCYTTKYEDLGLKALVTKMHCETEEPFYKIDKYDIIVGIFILVWATIIGIGTTYEGRARYKTKEEYERITNTKVGRMLSCFSVIKNWNSLSNSNINTSVSSLKPMYGIRFCSMLLVVFVHTCVSLYTTSTSNTTFFENISYYPLAVMVLNGTFVIQTFFVMSGWLLSYNAFIAMERKQSIKSYTANLFIHRYIRFTSSLLIVIAVCSTWMYQFGRGPNWDKLVGTEYRHCRANWWTNILYINNFYNPENMCLQQTWYLACDTQLFVISLAIIALLWRYQKHTMLILSICIVIASSIPGIVNYIYDYDIIIRYYPEILYNFLLDVPQWHKMYSATYSNGGSYIIGLLFGYLFYKYGNEKIFTTKIRVILWWIFGWVMALSIVFTGIPIYNDNYEHSRIFAAIYVSLSRNLFGISFAIIIFGNAQKLGWIQRYILNWTPVQILGRLTYSTYLVHSVVVRIRAGLVRSPTYITTYVLLTYALSDIVAAYAVALILHLSVEMPVSTFFKLLLQPRTKREPANAKVNDDVDNSIRISKM